MSLSGAASGGYHFFGEVGVSAVSAIIFRWGEGIAYLVVQDPAVRGLAQGGVKRDRLMGAAQRLGL
jgi:hypothetical protein